MIELTTTERGTVIGRFEDRYSAPCIIFQGPAQAHGIAALIRIGIEDDHGIQIHLTRKNATDLIPLLQAFVATGKLQQEAPQEPNQEALALTGREYRLVIAHNALADHEAELVNTEAMTDINAAKCERLRQRITHWRKTIKDLGGSL